MVNWRENLKMYLETINQPSDIKGFTTKQLEELGAEIREALLTKASKRGGHFGPNLGMVEATIALHYVFDSPKDKLVFDVSHQTYPHKMLTGRKDAFLHEEHYGDVTGYSNPEESEHDHFVIGHTSTSISLACGLAKARDLKKEDGNIIAIIGDGSLSGGEALEGLNFAPELNSNMIIVVNDNDMSIAENHGGLYENLKLLRDTNGTAKCNLFKSMGLNYVFVEDGNDLNQLIPAFEGVKDSKTPVVVHICTLKGKGYEFAEKNKESWHATAPFTLETGERLGQSGGENYSSVAFDYLSEKMKNDSLVSVITSGTPGILGFTADKRKEAGEQFIDVGIAEETAVALASGMAANGTKPVYGVFSSFIQRTYDQLSQDLCINSNPAVIVVGLATIYGFNDVTHLGIFDIPMMSNIPNLVYLAPTNKEEYLAMLEWGIEQNEHPVAIRVPGGQVVSSGKEVKKDFSKLNSYEITKEGSKIAIVGLGTFYGLGESVADKIKEETGIESTVINPMYITGLDKRMLEQLKEDHDIVITLEDGILDGGFGEKISRFYGNSSVKVLNYGFKKEFIDRFDVSKVIEDNHLTIEQITEDIYSVIKN